MDNQTNIVIYVKDFSIVPGSRYRDEGEKAYSGQQFREEVLEPKYIEALNNKVKLVVNLDGTLGYGTSWLEEVFGGLARLYGVKDVLEIISIISDEEVYLIDDIKHYITHAKG